MKKFKVAAKVVLIGLSVFLLFVATLLLRVALCVTAAAIVCLPVVLIFGTSAGGIPVWAIVAVFASTFASTFLLASSGDS